MEQTIQKAVHGVKNSKIGLWSLSTGSYLFVDYFFDFFLYFIAIRQFGPIVGGGAVLFLGIAIDLYVLHLYDKSDRDMFGFEEIKKLRDYDGVNPWRLFISRTLKKGNIIAMFILAFYSNPCLTTIYMRPAGEKRRSMNIKDWVVFLVSFFVDIGWIFIVYGFVLIEKIISSTIVKLNVLI